MDLLEGNDWQKLRRSCSKCAALMFTSAWPPTCQDCQDKAKAEQERKKQEAIVAEVAAIQPNATVEDVGRLVDLIQSGEFTFRTYVPGNIWPRVNAFVANLRKYQAEILVANPSSRKWLEGVFGVVWEHEVEEQAKAKRAKARAERKKAKGNHQG